MLITQPTVRDAAQAAGVSESTVYRYLNEPAFQQAYQSLKSEIMRGTTNKIQLSAGIAIDTLITVMQTSKSDMARVMAASKILEMAYTAYEKEDLEARIVKIEKLAAGDDDL